MKLQLLATALCFGVSGIAVAADNQPMYGIASVSYNDGDAFQAGAEGVGFGVGFGYEFHRQWYVEAGYQQLLDESAENIVTIAEADSAEGLPQGLEAGGAYLALLGKASSNQGTLFYRLGVMALNRKASYYTDVDSGCDDELEGSVTTQILTQCVHDDTSVAGLAGLGFDFRLTTDWSVRTEYQYVRGSDDFESHGALIGVQYHF